MIYRPSVLYLLNFHYIIGPHPMLNHFMDVHRILYCLRQNDNAWMFLYFTFRDTALYIAFIILSRMLHDILDDDHIQWHPPLIGHYTNFWPLLIWTLLLNWTFYLIVQGFHRTYATGAACQQRTLTPPDTWSCPTLGLACVLMSRPISPELVLSPDFWISNTPRYFSFA